MSHHQTSIVHCLYMCINKCRLQEKKDASTTSLRACIVSITGPHQTSALTHGSSLLSAALFRKSYEQWFVSEILDIFYNNT